MPYLELKTNARAQNAVSPDNQREKKKKKKRKREKGRFRNVSSYLIVKVFRPPKPMKGP